MSGGVTTWMPTRLGWASEYVNAKVSVSALAEHDEVMHYSIPVVQESGTGQVEPGSSIDSDKLLVDREVLLISKLNPRKGTICLALPDPERLTVCSSEFIPMAESPGASLDFLAYLSSSSAFRQELEARVNSATKSHQRVTPTDILHAEIRLPSVEQQCKIVDFLDRETAQIDAVIAKQEELVGLLGERRSAVIAHAVTKGLNPDAPMKDSGVDWLGQVPVSWQLQRLGWLARCSSGDFISNEEFLPDHSPSATVPVIGGNGVTGYGARSNVSEPVLAIGRVGALCGNVHRIDAPAWITDNALRLTLITDMDLDYLVLVLRVRNLNEIAMRTAQPLVTGGQVVAQRVPVPPLDAQTAIVRHVSESTRHIDQLMEKARESIELMRERRAALISDAVTGRLDIDTYGKGAA